MGKTPVYFLGHGGVRFRFIPYRKHIDSMLMAFTAEYYVRS